MDPLSISLAVISLVTAARDIVQLGQKIHDAFSKAPKGLRAAQTLSEELKEMLDDLAAFCEQNHDGLARSTDFRTVLKDLLMKLRGFESRVLPLLPSSTQHTKRNFFIRGWDTWRKSDEIERSIRELKRDVKVVVRKYMVMGVLRTEANTERIYHSTSQGLQVLESMQREISDLRVSTVVATTLAVTSPTSAFSSSTPLFDIQLDAAISKLAATSSSTSAPMLQSPSSINDEIISTAYIKFQISNIVALLSAVSELPSALCTPGSNALQDREFSLALVIPEHSTNIVQLRRQAIRQVTHICELLEMTLTETSIYQGVSALSQLALHLGSLKMDVDAVVIDEWVVRLSRILLEHTGHPDARVDLARNLLNFSIDLQSVGNDVASLAAIKEAYSITLGEVQCQEGQSTPTQVLLLHCLVLDHYALTLSQSDIEYPKPLELVMDSVQIMEGILAASTGLELQGSVGRTDRASLAQHPSLAIFKDEMIKYAQARSILANLLATDGQSEDALVSMRLALALLHALATLDARITPQLAIALYEAVVSDTSVIFWDEERLDYAHECVVLYRDLAHMNPAYYTRPLIKILWAKADLLRTMKRHEEALDVWKEVVALAKQLAQDDRLYAAALDNLSHQFRLLRRFDDAADTRSLAITASQGTSIDVQADRYYSLYGDLQLASRYIEAVQATRASLALYRTLAVRQPKKWAEDVAMGLSALAECLLLAGDYDNAWLASQESIQAFDDLCVTYPQPWPSAGHLNTLRMIHNTAFHIDDDAKSMALLSNVIRRCTALVDKFPEAEYAKEDMLFFQHCYGVNLRRLGRLIEAQQHFERLLVSWEKDVSDGYIAIRYSIALEEYAGLLRDAGQTNYAVASLDRALNVRASHTESCTFQQNVDTICRKIIFMVELGHGEAAFPLAEETLRLARTAEDVDFEDLVDSFHAVATAASRLSLYGRLVEVAREALSICQKDEIARPLTQRPDNPLCERATKLPRSLKLLSFGLASLERVHDGLHYAREAVMCAQKLRTVPCLASSVATRTHIETRANLGDMLLASGDLLEALETFEECRRYFSQSAETRSGDHWDLVPILIKLGTLYCNAGRHDEGIAVANNAQQIMRGLKAALPTLHEQIISRLRHDLATPVLQGFVCIRTGLPCGHQIYSLETPTV